MCGRFIIDDEVYADIWKILANIAAEKNAVNALAVKGEIFPTNIVPVYTPEGADAVKWGFPKWKGAGVIINARAETALEKSMFRKPLLERRCVIPSSGFYEWDHAGANIAGAANAGADITGAGAKKKKDKYLLRQPGERALYMAGMINRFRDSDGSYYDAFVILTTGANESVALIHDRMPVILGSDEKDRWINDAGFMEHALYRAGPVLELIPA